MSVYMYICVDIWLHLCAFDGSPLGASATARCSGRVGSRWVALGLECHVKS